MTEQQQRFIERLEGNVAKAAARVARVASRIEEAQAAGIDTSTYDPATSAQAPDYTLRKLEARLAFAERELDTYRARVSA